MGRHHVHSRQCSRDDVPVDTAVRRLFHHNSPPALVLHRFVLRAAALVVVGTSMEVNGRAAVAIGAPVACNGTVRYNGICEPLGFPPRMNCETLAKFLFVLVMFSQCTD